MRDRRMHRGRIAQCKPDQVLIHRDDKHFAWAEYAALVLNASEPTPAPPSRPALTREDFKSGDPVAFEGRDLFEHVGTIVRRNQKSATVRCPEGEWNVSYSLLRRVVDI